MDKTQLKTNDTILVVDDCSINNRVVTSLLRKGGYLVLTANNGQECIKISEEQHPDLILLDINMPVMNGIEACNILKMNQKTNDIPIIFVTASMDNETLNTAFEAGGTDYVRKPVNKIELLARIKSSLSEKKYNQVLLEKEKLSVLLEMAGAICHEINQPLQTIYMYFDSLSDNHAGISTESRLYKDIEKVKKQIYRISEITKKVSLINKYESQPYARGTRIIDINKASTPIPENPKVGI